MSARELSTAFQRLWEAYEHFYYAEHLLNQAVLARAEGRPASSCRAIGSMAAEYLTFALDAITSVNARSSLGDASDVAPVLPRGLRSVAGV